MSSELTKALTTTAKQVGNLQKIDNEGIYGPYNELYKNMDCFGKIYCFTL